MGDSDIGFHYASQHAGPYWVKKGLQRSKVVTDDMSEVEYLLQQNICKVAGLARADVLSMLY